MRRGNKKQPAEWLNLVGTLDPDTAWFAVDDQQKITWWSPGAESLLGFQAEDVVGQHCSKAVLCVRCGVACGLKQYGRIRDKPIAHYHKDGRELPLIKSAVTLKDSKGEFLGGVEMLRLDKRANHNEGGGESVDFHGIVTGDMAFKRFLTELRGPAHADVNLLIRGETGSGKEMVARAVHAMSRRSGKPFVAVNCGTLSKEFLASEIFGHRRGAFTGAVSEKRGLLEEAEGGTLFLDEVAEMPLDVQASLLRVIQERRYRPLGDTRDRPTDVRIISATNTALREAVDKGSFREDLMYRLRVVPLFLPPLRDRPADIAILWEHGLKEAATRHQLEPARTSQAVLDRLYHHPWPGNVRELLNLAEFVTVTRSGQDVQVEHLLPEFLESKALEKPLRPVKPGGRSVSLTRGEIEQAFEEAEGSIEGAAEILGVSRITLWRRRKKLGML